MAHNYERGSEGLQVVERSDYPEVVAQESQLEVANPEQHTISKRYAYGPEEYPRADSRKNNDAWPEAHESKGMIASASKVKDEQRRMYGLRRLHFWLLIGLLIVVTLAAILGGALGAHFRKSRPSDRDSPSPSPDADNSTASSRAGIFAAGHAQDKSGLALASSGPDLIHAYFMNEDNQIIEADYWNKTWASPDGEPHAVRNVTSKAGKGSPVAAVAYKFEDGAQRRQIFFYDTHGLVSTVNVTDEGAWGEAYNLVTDITSHPRAKGLAACIGTDEGGLKGMRVYVADARGYIQEIGFNFDYSHYPAWHIWVGFADGSDAEAGVACNLVGDTNHLYFRNKTTSLLHQWTWRYADHTSAWLAGPRSTNVAVAQGGSIATATDGKGTDYLFLQSDNDTVMHGLFTGGSISDFTAQVPAMDAATVGYHLAAVWTDEATMLNQIAQHPKKLTFSTVSRAGEAREGTVVST